MKTSLHGSLQRPFDIAEFLVKLLRDIAPTLTTRAYSYLIDAVDPCAGVTDTVWEMYWGDTPRNPLADSDAGLFRRRIKQLLSEADCMESVGYFAALRQVDACVSKLPSWGATDATTRRQKALEKFQRSEASCKRANRRISWFAARPGRLAPLVRQVLDMAKLDLFRALGPVPDHETLFGESAFGPGLTFGLAAEKRNLMYKISDSQTVTPEFRPLAVELLRDIFPHWASLLARKGLRLSTVPGNRVAFVPKSCDIDRTIGIEPSLNVFFQKGVDEYLDRRIRSLGLRLTDQEYSSEVIQRCGSSVATIDLSSASDSVAIEAVRLLLPREWFLLLDVLRSKNFTLDKGITWTRYEKFSSMGNATTFPLESMIFMSLARAVCRTIGFDYGQIGDCVRVYGDDIIVPWEAAALLMEVLRFLGFATNTDKTFVFGPFRETCGVDILHGVNVRPVYLRSIPTRPWNVANLFNRLLTNQFGFTYPHTLAYLHSLVRKPFYGPAYYGWASVRSTDWIEWYAGRNSEGDAYFFSPHPHTEGVSVSRQSHTQRWHVLERWCLVRRKLKGSFDEDARYLAFLLGLTEGVPLDHRPTYGTSVKLFAGDFPQLDWWPEVYAAPRPLSDRILRHVMDAALGGKV